MQQRQCLTIAVAFFLLFQAASTVLPANAEPARLLCGHIYHFVPDVHIRVRLYSLPTSSFVLSKQVILGSLIEGIPPEFEEVEANKTSPTSAKYCFKLYFTTAVQAFAVFGYADLNSNGALDPSVEPLGWHTTEPAGPPAPLSNVSSGAVLPPFKLRSTTALQPRGVKDGSLRQARNQRFHIMKLNGNATERAYAHGRLVARQIVDWFEFYILESRLMSSKLYETHYVPLLRSDFALLNDPQFVMEANALLAGMAKSAQEKRDPYLLFVESLSRNFTLVDLVAVQAYDVLGTECSQFVAWGSRSKTGETVTARNMDDEIDIRHVTVTHVILFDVAPTEPGHKRFLSMMWPGHLGTVSALNQDGLYMMMNAGIERPGGGNASKGSFAKAWIGRTIVERLSAAAASPATTTALIDSFKSSSGGACTTGCIIVIARPMSSISGSDHMDPPGYIYEGDHLGGTIRLAGMAQPFQNNLIMATNHFLSLGVDHKDAAQLPYPGALTCCVGCECSFSSQYRFMTGLQTHAAWARQRQHLDARHARTWLQRVAHGTSEYSIVTLPAKRKMGIMVAGTSQLWDAPYSEPLWFSVDTSEEETDEVVLWS